MEDKDDDCPSKSRQYMHDEDVEDGDAFQLFLISSVVSEMYPPKKYIQIIAITMSDENQVNQMVAAESDSEFVDLHGTSLMSNPEVAEKSSSEKKYKKKEKKEKTLVLKIRHCLVCFSLKRLYFVQSFIWNLFEMLANSFSLLSTSKT